MRSYRSTLSSIIVAGLCSGGVLVAQQTGGMTVVIKDNSGKALSGVRVELRSEKLIAPRVGTTDANGIFRAPLLPPGSYTGTLSRDGFRTQGLTGTVAMGSTATIESVMKTSEAATAVVTVVASAAKVDKTEVSVKENFSQDDILTLPVARTLDGISKLAPGVTTNQSGYTVIGGAASYENKFLVNGTDIGDSYFGSSTELYIEDAIDETQVMTNAISAEQGRFTGGVINAITRRGGNEFSGSLRVKLSNNDWNAVLPKQKRATISDTLNKVFIATVGGPIIKDRLWFFVAAQDRKVDAAKNLAITGIDYTTSTKEPRYEANLSWQITNDQKLTGSYLSRETTVANTTGISSSDATPEQLRNRKNTYSISTLAYDLIVNPTLNMNITAAQKLQKFTSSGLNEKSTDFYNSPVWDNVNGGLLNNHYFGISPEERNNQTFKVTMTKFLELAGQHEIKLGYEYFAEINKGSNPQSTSGYVIDASATSLDGSSQDWQNTTYTFLSTDDPDNGVYRAYLEDWTKAEGGTYRAEYNSLFVNDNYTINKHWNASIGFRYDRWNGDRSAGYNGPIVKTLVPRFALNYDVSGDSVWQIRASYGQYAGKINANIAQAGTYVGNPAYYKYMYIGADTTTSTPGANSLGFRRSDYDTTPSQIIDAKLSIKIDPNLKAPLTTEWTLGGVHKFSDVTNATVTYIFRKNTRLLENYIGDDGTWSYGPLTYSYTRWGNTPSGVYQLYRAIEATAETAFRDVMGGNLMLRGNLTLSHSVGNYDADLGSNSPGGGTDYGNYVGCQINNSPFGYLSTDEPVRVKVFGAWSRQVLGDNKLTVSMNFDYASGHPYDIKATVGNSNTGLYVDADGQTYTRYYTDRRGVNRFNATRLADLAVQWDGKIFRSAGYFVKFTAFNFLNHIQQATWNTTVNGGSTTWTPGPNYGKATSSSNFVGNRNLLLDVGFKF